MIVPIFGSPGCGKTTLGNALMKKFGYPFFELSWMPELKVMNSKKISYEQEEKIAIFALLNVAKTYCEHGHQVVLISDFRFDSFDLVMQNIGLGSPVIKLISSDENVLRSRVLDNSRPSAYRNANEALDLNEKMLLRTFENQLTIDVSKYDLETEINLISNFFIALTNK
jgi:hypothetical protein